MAELQFACPFTRFSANTAVAQKKHGQKTNLGKRNQQSQDVQVNALKEARHETSIAYVMDFLFTQIPFAFFVHAESRCSGMFYVNSATIDFLSIFQNARLPYRPDQHDHE